MLNQMLRATQGKPVVLINPKLADIQSAGGVMGVRGRDGRLSFTASFTTAYHFRPVGCGVGCPAI